MPRVPSRTEAQGGGSVDAQELRISLPSQDLPKFKKITVETGTSRMGEKPSTALALGPDAWPAWIGARPPAAERIKQSRRLGSALSCTQGQWGVCLADIWCPPGATAPGSLSRGEGHIA